MTELAVLVPTRGRPGNLKAQLNCWALTGAVAADGVAIVPILDLDDPEYPQYEAMIARMKVQLPALQISVATVEHHVPMVHKLDYVANQLAPQVFALGFAGDDHWPRTEHWHRRYLATLRQLGTGIVHGNDLIQGSKLPTEWAMTADIVRALGRMVPAPVQHLYCDNAIRRLGQALGRLRYLPDVVIEHMHPVAQKAPMDHQYARVNSPVQYQQDGTRFHQWAKGGGPGRAAAKVWVDIREREAMLEVREG